MRAQGFTLVEMMAALAVIMLVMSSGVPLWRSLVDDARVSGLASHYLHGYNSARYAAVAVHRPVTMCPLAVDDRCDGGWGKHFVLFYDDERDGRMTSPSDLIDRVDLGGGKEVSVSFKAFGKTKYVSLRSDGRYRQNGTFRICPRGGGVGRAIVINVTGRARTEKIDCS